MKSEEQAFTAARLQGLLDLEMQQNDSGATTIRGYLKALLRDVWTYGEGFDGKRPFGNSGWESDIYLAMVRGGMAEGTLDEDGYLDVLTHAGEQAANAFVLAAIGSL